MDAMSQRIVFLDIDGVLVNRRSLRERSGLRAVADPLCVAALNRITESTGAKIVLSSAWRFCGLEGMRLILNHWGVVAELIGMTPDLTLVPQAPGHQYVGVPRGLEIRQWIEAHAEVVENLAILDDDCDMGSLMTFHVQTQFEEGLNEEQADLAIRMLTLAPSHPSNCY